MNKRKIIKLLTSLILYYSGLVPLLRKFLPRRGVIILAYHRIYSLDVDPLGMAISPRDFAIHMKYIAGHYRPVSLSTAVEELDKEPLNTVVISFDDGYEDNYRYAFPVLRQNCVPAIIFLTVGPIEKRESLWYDRIVAAIMNSTGSYLDLTAFGLNSWSLSERSHRVACAQEVAQLVKRNLDRKQILALIHNLEAQADTTAGFQMEMLTWDQIREMNSAGIEFGAHTVNHPIMAILPPEEQQEEISEAKRRIEKETGRSVHFFAYPNGEAADFNEHTIELLKSSGYRAAVTLIPGENRGVNQYTLRRIGIDDGHTGVKSFGTKAVFACELSGVFDFLLRARRSQEPAAQKRPDYEPSTLKDAIG